MTGAVGPSIAVREFCLGCGLAEPEPFFARMGKLAELLAAANAQFNLTRIGPGEDFWLRHVADSLAAGWQLPELRTGRWRLLDLGCGAGFPGLVLAAAYPGITVVALDSNHRKVEFVAATAAALGLVNCAGVAGRGREYAASLGTRDDGFDLVTARAVGKAAELCREAHRLLRPAGRLVLYKTPMAAVTETAELGQRSPAKTYAWTVTPPYELPDAGGARVLIIGQRPAA